MHRRGNAAQARRCAVSWRYVHTGFDDRARIACSEACTNDNDATAAAFWQRGTAWFAQLGFARDRALTHNGACYRPDAFKAALAATSTTHKTTHRQGALNGQIHYYNHHRSHRALN